MMRPVVLWSVAVLVLAGHRAGAAPAIDVKVMTRAAELCDPSPEKGRPAEVAQLLGLDPRVVESDTICRLLEENVWNDDRPDYVFNFVNPTINGSRYQTILVYSAKGERVAQYHAQNLPLDPDIVARKHGLPSLLHLEGSGRWMEEALHWSGSFRIEDGRFVPVPEKSGALPQAPRCPNSKPLSIARQNGVHRRDLRAGICPNEECLLGCVDKTTPESCVHNVGAYWVGSFSAPDVLEVLLEMKAAGQEHGSILYLMQATACGWVQVGSLPGFAGAQDTCTMLRPRDRDIVVCSQRRAGTSADEDIVAYLYREALVSDIALHTHPTMGCNPKELVSSLVSDLSFDDPEDGVIPVSVEIDAARVTWTTKGADAESCPDATRRLTSKRKTYNLDLELTRDGLRLSPEQLDELKAHPIPGVALH
jgi:hypothetical protein